jgi:hypothetical protein
MQRPVRLMASVVMGQIRDGPVEIATELDFFRWGCRGRPNLGEGLLDEVVRQVDIVDQYIGIFPRGAPEAPYQRFEPGSLVRIQPVPLAPRLPSQHLTQGNCFKRQGIRLAPMHRVERPVGRG